MRAWIGWVVVVVLTGGAYSLHGQEPEARRKSPTSQPTDGKANEPGGTQARGPLTRLGNKLIARLKPIGFGTDDRTLLEAKRDDKPFATSRATLTDEGLGPAMRYRYADVSLLRSPDASVIEVKTTGILDRFFRPERLEWDIIRQAPDGRFKTRREAVVIGDKEILRTVTDADGKTTHQRFATPKRTFVYLTGDLLRMLDLEPGQRFILSDLDPDTGKLNRRTYEVTKDKRGRLRVGIRKHPSKVETEYYLLHGTGHIVRHVIHDLGMTFDAVSDGRIRGVEEAFRRRRRAD